MYLILRTSALSLVLSEVNSQIKELVTRYDVSTLLSERRTIIPVSVLSFVNIIYLYVS